MGRVQPSLCSSQISPGRAKLQGNRDLPRGRQDGSCCLLSVCSRAQEDNSLLCGTVFPHGSVLLYGPTLPLNGQSLFFLFPCSSLCPHPALCPALPGRAIPTNIQLCHVCQACTAWEKLPFCRDRGWRDAGRARGDRSRGCPCQEQLCAALNSQAPGAEQGQHLTGWGRKRCSSISSGWWDVSDL